MAAPPQTVRGASHTLAPPEATQAWPFLELLTHQERETTRNDSRTIEPENKNTTRTYDMYFVDAA